ncbi:MAG: hypothetical protein ABJD11_17160 [Gemmatimonadota bacterium]
MRIRIGLMDGSMMEGTLISASPDHISLMLPTVRAEYIPAESIRSVAVAEPRPVRELLPVSLVIVAATAVLVGLAQFPALTPYFPRIAGGLAIFGLVGIVQLKRRTRVGGWLTSWKALFERRD